MNLTPEHWWHWLWICPMVGVITYGLLIIAQDTCQYLDEWRAERRRLKHYVESGQHERTQRHIQALQAAKAREKYWNGRGRGYAPRQE